MRDIVIAILSSGILSGAVATLISVISAKKAKKRDNSVKIEVGLRLILLSTLKRDGKEALQKCKIAKDDYEAFLASYNAYKALGGDGWADKVYNQIKKLPVDIDD